jgi:predicted nucleotidyltransferase
MRTLDDIRKRLRAEIPYLREHYHVERLGICGSYVREEQTEGSDLDLLVTFTETPDLFEFIGLKHYLEDTLGLSVDLGMPDALRKGPAADNIRREVEYL